MLDHAATCQCGHCAAVRRHSVPVAQCDRDLLAELWELWIGRRDGEAAALHAGRDGNLGSPRWVALQAVARTRLSLTQPRNAFAPIGAGATTGDPR